MALVAYDNSDASGSDYEEDQDTTTTSTITSTAFKNEVSERLKYDEHIENSVGAVSQPEVEAPSSIFKLLPPTKQKLTIEEDDDEFLHKNPTVVKQKAKITVPSLSDFKDVEDTIPNNKPKAGCGKKSGLLSILPEPKNSVKATTKSLIPNVLAKKPVTAKKHLVSAPQVSKPNAGTTNSLPLNYSDDDSDDEDVNDFFSINKKHDIPADASIDSDVPSNSCVTVGSQERNVQSYFKDVPVDNELSNDPQVNQNHQDIDNYSQNAESSVSVSTDLELDDEAIRQLCGSRGRRKKEDIQIVDVNQQDVLADARQMLMMGLMDDTSKRVSSKRRGDGPTSQQKRKHQITYLAHQAKANEAELQNQWANSRMSRRQTQSKYGF